MKVLRTSLLLGLPIVALSTYWLTRSPSHDERAPRPRAALETVSKPAVETAAAAETLAKPATRPAAPSATPPTQDIRATLAAEAEGNRIAAREARYDELDWDAPRPGPPPPSERRMGKREAKLSSQDKLEQTVQMISLLKNRIVHTRARAAAGDARTLERLERRVAELNETAEALRNAPAASRQDG